MTDLAHEAGVETLPDYRKRGRALNVVAGRAGAVRKMGAIRFYSTSWNNLASQRVAARLKLRMYGVDFSITRFDSHCVLVTLLRSNGASAQYNWPWVSRVYCHAGIQ